MTCFKFLSDEYPPTKVLYRHVSLLTNQKSKMRKIRVILKTRGEVSVIEENLKEDGIVPFFPEGLLAEMASVYQTLRNRS